MRYPTPLLLLLVSALLPIKKVNADDGHFTIPDKAVPVKTGSVPITTITPIGNSDTPPVGCDRPALDAWFKAWRQRARQAYANQVAKNIPKLGLASPVPGASCIRSPDAFDARYEKNGDFFVLTCLAQSNGKLTHLFKLELKADPGSCLSDAKIQEWVNGTACMMPGGAKIYLNDMLKPCPIGTMPPQFRGSPVAFEIDPDFFSHLLNDRPSIQRIVDQERRIKVGGSRTSSSGCSNPLGCEPPNESNSSDVK